METPITQLNSVELIGIVGATQKTQAGDKASVRLQVATNFAYRDRDGCAVIETTWSDCVANEENHISAEDIAAVSKGDKVHIRGRMRTRRAYNGITDSCCTEIVVSSLEILHTDNMLQMQM